MKKKELGTDYIFFRGVSYYIVFFIPIISSSVNRFSITTWDLSEKLFEPQLLDSLQTIKISIGVILSIVLAYRWALIQTDGTYSFWLAQGIHREEFLRTIILQFLRLILFIHVIDLFLSYIAYGIYFSIIEYAQLLILVAISYFLLLSITLIIAELVKNPELSAISVIILFVVNFTFEGDLNTHLMMAINPETQVFEGNLPLTIILSLSLGAIVFSFLYVYHKWRDILY
ncbi:MAG: hypothetical protein ACXAD7_20930 [Candidatus Kariarchaeaceae archaeon]|jgi:hypothetical protein